MSKWIQLFIIILTMAACWLAGEYRASCYFMGACIAILFAVHFLYDYRKEKQIEEMVIYLTKLQDGLELPELTKCKEGQIGILQSELYKLIVLLQEQSSIAKKEKNYLAEMLSDISHQVKTPLTAVTLMADLLKEPGLSEEKRLKFVGNIDRQISKITWLIRNLLTLSQLEADVLQLKKERVLVRDILHKASQPLEILADIKGVTLYTGLNDSENTPQEDNIFIVCDEEWTAEAFSNIIKNCIEHTPEGGKVRVTATQHNFATDICIRDNGSGIAKEDLPYIFKRFYKGKHGAKDSVGIGLAMARQIILRQNGVISAESEEGAGTAFYLKFYSDTTRCPKK